MYMVLKNFLIAFLRVSVQFSQHCFSSTIYFCLLSHRLIKHRCMGLLMDFLFCSIDISVFVSVLFCFDDCSFVV